MQHILYRQKEQFSDGVGYSWIDGLKAHAAQHVYISYEPPIFLNSELHQKSNSYTNYLILFDSFLQVTDKMMLNAQHIYPHNTPTSKEAYYYRMIFERFFPQVTI